MVRWQGRWLIWTWLLLPGMAWGQEPLLIPRAPVTTEIATTDLAHSGTALKLGRSNHTAARGSGSASSKSSSGWGTLGSLLCVLGIVVAAAFLFSRHGARLSGMLPAEVVQILGKRYLDSRNSVQLIRCGSKILLVANSTQHGLSTLTEITDPVEVEQITAQCSPVAAQASRGSQINTVFRTATGPQSAGGPRG